MKITDYTFDFYKSEQKLEKQGRKGGKQQLVSRGHSVAISWNVKFNNSEVRETRFSSLILTMSS